MSWGAALLSQIVGLAVGWLAEGVVGGGRYGRRADLVTGLLGGVLGAWGLGAVGVYEGGLLGASIAAFAGAGASIAVLRRVRPASS